jgi:hypothetical protein
MRKPNISVLHYKHNQKLFTSYLSIKCALSDIQIIHDSASAYFVGQVSFIRLEGKASVSLDKIITVLSKVPGVSAIALGGSQSRGEADVNSDYDIGV